MSLRRDKGQIGDSPTGVARDGTKRRPRKNVALQITVAAVLLVIVCGAAIYLTGASFNRRMREVIVTELERTTGGRVEVNSFHWDLSHLEFEARDLTIHGLEPADELPYAHVDSLKVRLKIISVMQHQVALRYVEVRDPVVHLIVSKEGVINQPEPKIRSTDNKSPADELFDIGLEKLDVSNGELLINDHKVPFDLHAQDVSAQLDYDFANKQYHADFRAGGSTLAYGDFHPVRSNAELRATFDRSHAVIESLHWESARSKIDASGMVRDLRDPMADLTYRASIDLDEIAPLAAATGLRRGTMDVEGRGSGTLDRYTGTGRLQLHGGEYASGTVVVSGLDGSALYQADEKTLRLTNIFLRLLGGTARGDATFEQWTNASGPSPQRGAADLSLAGIDTRPAIKALSTKRVPLKEMSLSGTASGSVGMRWTGTPADADATIALNISPDGNVRGGVPVSGEMEGVYHGRTQSAEVSKLTLATPGATIASSGAIGQKSGTLQVAITSHDLTQWQPLFSALGYAHVPIEVKGIVSFQGTVSGGFDSPSVRGHLAATDFRTTSSILPETFTVSQSAGAKVSAVEHQGSRGRAGNVVVPTMAAAPVKPAAPPVRIHWDSLKLDLDYSPAALGVQNGELKHGASTINFNGAAQLSEGRFDGNSPFHVKLNLRNAAVNELEGIAGFSGAPYSALTGVLGADLEVDGTLGGLHGGGDLLVTGGTLYGEPYKQLRAKVAFSGAEAVLDDIVFSQDGATVTGAAGYNTQSSAFNIDLRGAGFDLAHLQSLKRYKAALTGKGNFTLQASGTPQVPVVNAHLRLEGVAINNEVVGEVSADAVTHGSEMSVTAHSTFRNADLRAGGNIHLRGDFPGDIKMQMSHFDVDPLLKAFLKGGLTGHSSVDMTAELTGPFRYPKLLTASGDIAKLGLELEKVRLQSDGPIRFSYAKQVAHIEQAHITGEDTNLTFGGSVDFAAVERGMDIRAHGAMNMKLLQEIDPGLQAHGETTFDVVVAGTVTDPRIRGQVEIKNAGLSFIDLPNGLADLNGTLIFNDSRLLVQQLTAHTGGGDLQLGGFITYQKGIYFDLTASGHDVRLRYPPGVSAVGNATVRLSGTTQSALLSGDVVVTRFGVNPRFDFALYLARSKQSPTLAPQNSVANNLKLDVRVVTTPELSVETSLAKISGDADFRIRGTAARPAVLGRINIADGEVFFNGTKYHLERGDILFANPLRIEPILNLEASARVRDYDITIGFHGSVDKLQTTYRSEPPLPSGDVIALLALGRTREETTMNSGSQPTNFTEATSNEVLGEALNATVSSRLQRLFGASRIKIDPQVGGPENNPNARITVEQQINNNVTLTYITNVSQSAQQIIQAEFNLSRNTSLVVIRDHNGVLVIDLRIRRTKR